LDLPDCVGCTREPILDSICVNCVRYLKYKKEYFENKLKTAGDYYDKVDGVRIITIDTSATII
jgi:hypothetical protein